MCPSTEKIVGTGDDSLVFLRYIAVFAVRGLAAVAQLVEHVIRNDGVVGSSPISGSKYLSCSQIALQCSRLKVRSSFTVLPASDRLEVVPLRRTS